MGWEHYTRVVVTQEDHNCVESALSPLWLRALERVMHFARGYTYMEAALERHPRVGGDLAYRDSLDARVRGQDHLAASTLCQRARVPNTL
jgi:hypothetical protein